MPHGPCSNSGQPITPPATKFGSSSVYVQTAKPASRPQNTPSRVAPRQYSPVMMAGANCATAANASNPMDARLAGAAVLWWYANASSAMRRIVTRRSQSTSLPTSAPRLRPSQRLRHSAGMMRSFVIIVASAMLATITIAVAADSPPRNARTAIADCAALHWQRQHERVRVECGRRVLRPAPPARPARRTE